MVTDRIYMVSVSGPNFGDFEDYYVYADDARWLPQWEYYLSRIRRQASEIESIIKNRVV